METDHRESGVTVTAQNRSAVTLPVEELRLLAERVLAAEAVSGPAQLDLVFVGPEEIAALNREHMGKEGPTDVLSFPIDTQPAVTDGPPRLIGDLVVCPEQAERAAAILDGSSRWTVTNELALLVVHGVLHLVGYDHAEASDRDRMQAREIALLADLADVDYVPGPETA